MSDLFDVVGTLEPAVAESMGDAVGDRILVYDDERDQVLVAERRTGGDSP
jgi:hypothetical protein